MLRSHLIHLFVCTVAIPAVVYSCKPGPFEGLKTPLYERLKNDEFDVTMQKRCKEGNPDNGHYTSSQDLIAKMKKCEAGQMDREMGKEVAMAIASYGLGAAASLATPFASLFPLAMLALIPTGECSSNDFLESLVDTKIVEDDLKRQVNLVRGWNNSYNNILDNTHRFDQLLALNMDMNNERYVFLSNVKKNKIRSAVTARNYLNARLTLMREIINREKRPQDSVLYRRQTLKLIREVVVYIKESVELARQYKYVESKDDTSFYTKLQSQRRTHIKSGWRYQFNYAEDTYDDLFLNQACPIVQLQNGSLLLSEWKTTADWLMDYAYADVCVRGQFDCQLVKQELTYPFRISAGCTVNIISSKKYTGYGSFPHKVFKSKQPCLKESSDTVPV